MGKSDDYIVPDYYLWVEFTNSFDKNAILKLETKKRFVPSREDFAVLLEQGTEAPKEETSTVPKSSGCEFAPVKPQLQPQIHNPNFDIEPQIYKKLATGKISINSILDLHGVTEPVAYEVIERYLIKSQQAKFRHILIITGKGKNGAGILQKNVPSWLKLGRLSKYVNAVATAAKHHGGSGAIYVRLKK